MLNLIVQPQQVQVRREVTPHLDDATNLAIELSAEGANRNIALMVSYGNFIMVKGEILVKENPCKTGYELVTSSGPQTRQCINGRYFG